MKISALGKLHDLSGLLGHCLRQGKMDIKHVIAIIDTLKFFIITQSTRLESAYVLEYQQAVRARAAFTSVNGPGPKSLKETKVSNSSVSSNNNILLKKNDMNTETKTSISNNNGNTTAKRPREVEHKAPQNVPMLPPQPLSADVILKNILEVFKEAYRWLKDMDKGEIFASKVLL